MSASKRSMRQPKITASHCFSQSEWIPLPREWRPPTQVPPSISQAIFKSGKAKSNRHRRVGWNRYSVSQPPTREALRCHENSISRSDAKMFQGCNNLVALGNVQFVGVTDRLAHNVSAVAEHCHVRLLAHRIDLLTLLLYVPAR